MSVSRLKTWVANEILTASDLNGEFNNILNNGQAIGFPRDGTVATDFNGQTLVLDSDGDTTLRSSTDDQIDIAIAGTDTYKLTATKMTIRGKRVLTVRDKAVIDSMLPRILTTEARVASVDSRVLAMNEMTNF